MLENGFYYHFKHDPSISVVHHAYEVVGLGWHTEDEAEVVLYRPLYKQDFMGDVGVAVRPLAMFLETVEREGKTMQRFTKITDEAVIAQLTDARNQLYGT
jgi:hypothetical protein